MVSALGKSVLFRKIFCLLVLFPASGYAADKSGAGDSDSGVSSASRSSRGPIEEFGRDLLYTSLALKLQYGKGGSENSTSVISRDFFNHGFQADIGTNWKDFIFALSFDYNNWKQIPSSSPNDNSNVSGAIFNVMPMIGYRYTYNFLSAFLKYIAHSKYSLVQNTANGYSASYGSPSNGYQMQVFYHHAKHSRIGLEYTSLNLQRSEIGGVETQLSSGAEMKFTSMGALYLWEF